MMEAVNPLRAGDVVRIRDERWRIVSRVAQGDTAIVEATGFDAANRGTRARFLLPFERIDRLPSSLEPRVVRPGRWRCAARRVFAEAAPSWTTLRTAVHADFALIPYQLEPALAFIGGHACRFLLADDVGLGKTVQAGLMIAEALARRPGARALVVSPAALRDQWHHELIARFRLSAEVLDAAGVARISAAVPQGVNPWSLPRVIVTSIDYVKRPEVMRAIETLTWDFVAFDEAHNLARRSDRAAAAHSIARRSRAVALLTATPHSGEDTAFQKLCGIGDIRGAYPLLMFRRTRSDAGMAGRRRTIVLRVRPTAAEAAMHAALMEYARRAWSESTGDVAAAGARLAMTVLTRRACSSAGSLARSIERRLALLADTPPSSAQLHLPFADVSSDDEEPEAWLGSRGLRDAREEDAVLRELLGLARTAANDESKVGCLGRLIKRINEPAIVFTEYRDTLQRLATAFPDVVAVQLHGGLTSRERVEALSRFTTGNARLLLATDAASEGLNLHHRCRVVINLELPWTPLRLDQRAGRVDRIGQARTVHAIRLVAAETCEESIVARLASRAYRIRNALGTMPDEGVVAESVFDAPPSPQPGIALSPGVTLIDMRTEAREEAGRLAGAKRWLCAGGDCQETRPFITRLRPRRASRRECLWAFRTALVNASDEILCETVVGAAARYRAIPVRSASATRAVLQCRPALMRVIADASVRELRALQEALSRPVALWIRRELDLIDMMREEHARMSASLLQAGLFDRRTERAAAAQAAMLDAAVARCRGRLEELRSCAHLREERCDLAFAVMRE